MLLSPHKFAIGTFGTNLSGAISATTVAENWSGSWEDNVALARLADEAGLDFMMPVGRWRGYGGSTDHNGNSFETLTWAGGLLASTRRIRVFGTVHVSLFHPVLAAKQMATVDHIGGGRFGLNVVCGWYEDEFRMFGLSAGETAEIRYDEGDEWLDIVTRIWNEDAPFDYNGRFFQLKGVKGDPKPKQRPRVPILNAGHSPRGRRFALQHADTMFFGVTDVATAAGELNKLKQDLSATGRNIGVYTNSFIVCRPTRKEAEEYYHWYAVENANHDAVETILRGRGYLNRNLSPEAVARLRQRIAGGNGGYPFIGTPDEVVAEMQKVNAIGIDGLALGFVNGLKYLPYIQAEVLPRLERAGLRNPR
ncbi:MAG: LLM class flavin-dependent oxidoreductase [Burkholderiales bacterium]